MWTKGFQILVWRCKLSCALVDVPLSCPSNWHNLGWFENSRSVLKPLPFMTVREPYQKDKTIFCEEAHCENRISSDSKQKPKKNSFNLQTRFWTPRQQPPVPNVQNYFWKGKWVQTSGLHMKQVPAIAFLTVEGGHLVSLHQYRSFVLLKGYLKQWQNSPLSAT